MFAPITTIALRYLWSDHLGGNDHLLSNSHEQTSVGGGNLFTYLLFNLESSLIRNNSSPEHARRPCY